jgi:hypothetical protein
MRRHTDSGLALNDTNRGRVTVRTSIWARLSAAVAVACVLAATAGVQESRAAFGDEFGAAPINEHPLATDQVPALPGQNRAFWAGACDRSGAPPIGADLEALGGIGARPEQILAGVSNLTPRIPAFKAQAFLAAPAVPDHCLDYGAMSLYVAGSGWLDLDHPQIWQRMPWGGSAVGDIGQTEPAFGCGDALVPCEFAPKWRLPALTQAGSRPDGTAMVAMARNRDGVGVPAGNPDGSVDNIRVDLPPGFVGNPQAVTQCSAVEFREVPLRCPPSSQVGLLRLYLVGICEATPCNLGRSYDASYPLYNLVPREGNAAEIGFSYAGGATNVRLVAKPRTNSDFGVTAFVGQIPAALPVIAQSATLWGVPWAAENDMWRTRYPDRVGAPTVCRNQIGTPTATNSEYIAATGLPAECQAPYDPSWGGNAAERTIRPFLTNETDCNAGPVSRLVMDAFQRPGALTAEGDPAIAPYPQVENEDAPHGSEENPTGWATFASTSPPVTGCEELAFSPDIDFDSTTGSADGASGLDVGLSIPQNNTPPASPPALGASQLEIDDYVEAAGAFWDSPAGRATAHLKDTVVTLPEGMSVNPSAAAGLEGCNDSQIGLRQPGSPPLFNNGDPFDKDGGADGAECPDASKIGTVRVHTPLLAEELTGDVVLGTPKSTDPASGEMFRLFIVARNEDRGIVAKIYGSTTADPQTGKLTTRFLNNPELPFDRLDLDIEGGARGVLGLPQRCGSHGWQTTLTPWSSVGAPVPVADVDDDGSIALDANCGFGFSPTLDAGMSTKRARAHGAFSFRFSRSDGEQWLRGLTAKLPQGLLASVRGVPLCSNAQAGAGACPAGSKVGIVDAKAGSGDPFVLEEKGEVFLTEGYKGGEYGLAVKIRPVAGPFRGDMELSPIVVRQAIHVDRATAQVTAVSDPFPLIHHGVPLRVREATVLINRPSFMLNPSDCDPKQIGADITSAQGAVASPSSPFRASGCASLPFKPKLALRLTGRKQTRTGKHPGVRAKVTQRGIGEAGIEKAVVRLPKSLALDPANAQALCEFADGTKPDLESHCPKGSIVGRARATSPLLNDPLVGNVYFVKNVRVDPRTGNEIRTLPMIIVALRGEIAINLKGESATTKSGKLVNTFASVPDAPVSQFNLNIKGGKTGIIAVTRTRKARINLCTKRKSHVADSDMDGHNGKRYDRNIRMKTPCAAKRRAAKRKAAKEQARRTHRG